MTAITQPLRDEHQHLLPEVERLRLAAEAIGNEPRDTLRERVADAVTFLTRHLIPHALAEDQVLYPFVGWVLGAAEATSTMSRDHVEVGRLTGELARLQANLGGSDIAASDTEALRRVLYGLYAVVKLHFAKEDEVYLPLLDARLSPGEAHRMFAAMEAAAETAKAA